MDAIPIIDAHFHFWDHGAGRHPWLAGIGDKDFFLGDYRALRRDYLPADYWRDAGDLPVVKLVHCEAEWDRDDQVGETAWLTHLHATTGCRAPWSAMPGSTTRPWTPFSPATANPR